MAAIFDNSVEQQQRVQNIMRQLQVAKYNWKAWNPTQAYTDFAFQIVLIVTEDANSSREIIERMKQLFPAETTNLAWLAFPPTFSDASLYNRLKEAIYWVQNQKQPGLQQQPITSSQLQQQREQTPPSNFEFIFESPNLPDRYWATYAILDPLLQGTPLQKILYIGETGDLARRFHDHIETDPSMPSAEDRSICTDYRRKNPDHKLAMIIIDEYQNRKPALHDGKMVYSKKPLPIIFRGQCFFGIDSFHCTLL